MPESVHDPARLDREETAGGTEVDGSLVAKTSWSALATAATAIGAAVTGVLVYRMLTPSEAGTFAYATWFASLGGAVFGFGVPAALTRHVAAARSSGVPEAGLARWLTRRGLVATAAASPIFVVLWTQIPHAEQRALPVAVVVALFGAQTAAALATASLSGAEAFRRLSRWNLATALMSVVVVPVGASILGATGAVLGATLASVPLCLVAFRAAAHGSTFRPPDALASTIWRYAGAAWISSIVTAVVWSRAEVLFLERSAGSTAVAMFGVGAFVAQIAAQGPLLLVGALVPHFTRQAAVSSHATLAATYQSTFRVLALAVLPVCFWVASLVPWIVPLLFGTSYGDSVTASAVLVAAAPLGVLGTAASSLVLALGRSRFIAIAGVLGAVIACAWYAALIPRYGTIGAAGARLAAHACAAAIGLSYLRIRLGVRSPLRDVLMIALAALVSAAAGRGIMQISSGHWGLAAAAVTMTTSYVLVLRITRALSAAETRKLLAAVEALPASLAKPARMAIRLASPARARRESPGS